MFNKFLYIPEPVRIKDIRRESVDTKTFVLEFENGDSPDSYFPGQFVIVSVPGVGEAPISVASSPTQKGILELCVRKVGKFTAALHSLAAGDEIGIRGPYGTFFDIDSFKGDSLLFVSGGVGIAPLRGFIRYVLDNREKYKDVALFYGTRTEEDGIFKKEIFQWSEEKDIEVYWTVERAEEQWQGHRGVVTELFDKVGDFNKRKVFVCGPPLMIRFAVERALALGVSEEDIYLSLERYMKCGIGKCGHCYLNGKYLCTDGPVLRWSEVGEDLITA